MTMSAPVFTFAISKVAFTISFTDRSVKARFSLPSSKDSSPEIIFWLPSSSRAFLSSGGNMITRAVVATNARRLTIQKIVFSRSTYTNTVKPRMTTIPFSSVQALVFLIQSRIS